MILELKSVKVNIVCPQKQLLGVWILIVTHIADAKFAVM